MNGVFFLISPLIAFIRLPPHPPRPPRPPRVPDVGAERQKGAHLLPGPVQAREMLSAAIGSTFFSLARVYCRDDQRTRLLAAIPVAVDGCSATVAAAAAADPHGRVGRGR